MTNLKNIITKLTSFILLFSGAYQTLLSLNAIFFIYPHLNPHQEEVIIKEGLIEKAFLLFATMVVDGIYGIILLIKPSKKIEVIHLIAGMVLIVVSFFFITQTPFTTDPLSNLIRSCFNN